MSSETTAAATGAVGVLRHDPMAMKPLVLGETDDHFVVASETVAFATIISHIPSSVNGFPGMKQIFLQTLWPEGRK